MAMRVLSHARAASTVLTGQFRRGTHSVAIRAFGGDVAESLTAQGYAVWDNAISSADAATLRGEIDLLAARGELQSNATHLVSLSGNRVALRKRGVLEAEVHTLPSATRDAIPALVSVEQGAELCALLSVLQPRLTLRKQAVKAVFGEGDGACFPVHADSAAAVDKRVVTALLYLNDGWTEPRDGGALRVYPFPGPPVDIAPVTGRLVLLSATRLLHRVLPARAPRYSLTIWLSGSYRAPPDPDPAAVPDEDAAIAAALLAPGVRPLVARIALADEWDQSLRDAHPAEEARAAIRRHVRDRRTIAERLPPQIASTVARNSVRTDAVEERVRTLFAHPEELMRVLHAHSDGGDGRWL